VLRVLEPALRMKAQEDSSSRGRKDFICREEPALRMKAQTLTAEVGKILFVENLVG
jgi:hypothetical protein